MYEAVKVFSADSLLYQLTQSLALAKFLCTTLRGLLSLSFSIIKQARRTSNVPGKFEITENKVSLKLIDT